MKVEILKPKAYCAGVSNAIQLAYKAREENPDKKVYVLGMLVHNNFVVEELQKKDIQIALDINLTDKSNKSSLLLFAPLMIYGAWTISLLSSIPDCLMSSLPS